MCPRHSLPVISTLRGKFPSSNLFFSSKAAGFFLLMNKTDFKKSLLINLHLKIKKSELN